MALRTLKDPEGNYHLADEDGALCGLDWLYSIAGEDFEEAPTRPANAPVCAACVNSLEAAAEAAKAP